MKTYTLHVPRGARPGDPEALEYAKLVRDGFSWGAFFFTVLWFLFHRLWLAGLGVLLALLALMALLRALDVQPFAGFLTMLLAQVLIGLEASSLRRWTYARTGRPAVGAVMGRDREEAEAKAFARWLPAGTEPKPAGPARAASPPMPYSTSEPVIGLFPEAERGR